MEVMTFLKEPLETQQFPLILCCSLAQCKSCTLTQWVNVKLRIKIETKWVEALKQVEMWKKKSSHPFPKFCATVMSDCCYKFLT